MSDPDYLLRAEGERRIAIGAGELHRWSQTEVVGVPEEVLVELLPVTEAALRDAPFLLHEPTFSSQHAARRFTSVRQRTLFFASDSTTSEIHIWASELETAMRNLQWVVLPGEWHGVDDSTLTQVITRFVSGSLTDVAQP